ncbi:hypothetical protein BT93_A1541 [Corymbia citriodora subsp. variegata]|nr:hypothetical protein BT93_A1541 [Corymbia citriodora subsp. variegata]
MPVLVHWFRQASFKRDHLHDASLNASVNIPDDNALVSVEVSTKYFACFLIPPTLRSLTSSSFLSTNIYTSQHPCGMRHFVEDTNLKISLDKSRDIKNVGPRIVKILISANKSLSGNQTLISSGGNFKLGFFAPGNSMYSYIGIWYNKISVQTVVWVANRDNPVTDMYSTELKISGGNLVMVNDSAVPFWSKNLTASSSGSSSMVASFDHPTHMWLPGAKIGIDKCKNTSQLLTSWKNAEDPLTGLFSLQLEPSSEYYIWWNRSEHYWTIGVWDNRTKIFSLVPEMRLNNIYDFKYVDNENKSYLTCSVYNTANAISRLVMDLSGQNKMLSWLPSSQEWNFKSTDNFCSCLPGFNISSLRDWNLSDWSGGCKRNSDLNCAENASNAEKDGLSLRSNMKLPESPQSLNVGSHQECQAACLNNFSCTAYAFKDNNCSIWIGDLFNVQQLAQGDSTASSLYLRLATSDVQNPSKKSNVTVIVAGSVSAAVVILAIVLFGVWRWRRRPSVTTKTVEGSLIAFAYRDLQVATKNFSEKLGGGGFGSVVKVTLPDSRSTIGTIQHVNFLRLRRFCSKGDKRLLVYDFMPNGSLDYHLFHRKNSKTLDWKTRLHHTCDIKPENILLDAEFYPKVADFGLAKLVGRDFSRVLTTIRGTRGYPAPKWISGVAITAKADVYSYGMMLFEFVLGRRNSELLENGAIKFFPTWAMRKVSEGGDLLDFLDPNLEANADTEELTRICRVACWRRRALQVLLDNQEHVVFFTESSLPNQSSQMKNNTSTALLDNQEHVVFFTESSSPNQSSQTKNNTSTASLQNQNSSASTKSSLEDDMINA